MVPWVATVVLATLGGIPTTLDVSGGLESRLDARLLRSRLAEEGFTLTSPAHARLLLVVAPHAQAVEIQAVRATARLSRIVEAPDEVWATELAQRLSALAHEAAEHLPPEAQAPGVQVLAGSPGGSPDGTGHHRRQGHRPGRRRRPRRRGWTPRRTWGARASS